MLLISFVFSLFEVWQFTSPVPKELVELLAGAIFALLGVIFAGIKLFQAVKYDITGPRVRQLIQ